MSSTNDLYQFRGERTLRDGSLLSSPSRLKEGGDATLISRTFADGECWTVDMCIGGSGAVRRSMSEDSVGWEEEWMYEEFFHAVIGLITFDRGRSLELDGWVRHVPTMRRREHGDPATEYVRP